MVEINLLPDVKRDLLKAQQLRNIVTFVSIVIGGAMLAGVVLLFLTTKGQELLMSLKTSEISNKFADMQKIQDGETAATLRNQLNAIQKIQLKVRQTMAFQLLKLSSRQLNIHKLFTTVKILNVRLAKLKKMPIFA